MPYITARHYSSELKTAKALLVVGARPNFMKAGSGAGGPYDDVSCGPKLVTVVCIELSEDANAAHALLQSAAWTIVYCLSQTRPWVPKEVKSLEAKEDLD